MFRSEEVFGNVKRESPSIYELRDKLLTLQKLGCTPRVLNVLDVKFDPEFTLTELVEEFPRVEGLFLSSDIDGRQVRGMRKLTQLKEVIVVFGDPAEKNELRLPKGVRNLCLIPICITDAEYISDFLSQSLCSRPDGNITLVLEMPDLVYNWDRLKIPKTVTRVCCTKRRNLPRGLLKVFRDSGFYRKERTEDEVIYERGLETSPECESPEKEFGPFSEEEGGISEIIQEELILKIIKEAFCG